MTDTIHSCSPFCMLPACVVQREHLDFEAFLSTPAPDNYDASNADAWHIWQAATERATALERERCARVCEVNQVAHNVKQGHFLVNWPIESYGVHEGMTYAAAIRQGGTHD